MSPASDYLPNISAPVAYLIPQIEAFYPQDAAEFRALYQYQENNAPQYRREGLEAMTDEDIKALAKALCDAMVYAPHRVQELWGVVVEQGRLLNELIP